MILAWGLTAAAGLEAAGKNGPLEKASHRRFIVAEQNAFSGLKSFLQRREHGYDSPEDLLEHRLLDKT
jgi:hypothetical protein